MSHNPKNPKRNDVHGEPKEPFKPDIVDEAKWLEQRKELLAAEKDALRAYDAMIALRRKLSWTPVKKSYTFTTASGDKVSLADLIKGDRPLILQHFMWPKQFDSGCSSCALWTDTIVGFLPQLSERADFAVTMHAPSQDKFKEFLAVKKWWPSACNIVNMTDYEFGEDFQVSQKPEDVEAGKDMTYNFKMGPNPFGGLTELPGFSVFTKDKDGQVFRTYSCYARGLEPLSSYWAILDMLPGGRLGKGHPRHREEYDVPGSAQPAAKKE